MDAGTAAVRVIASAPGTRHVTPTWRPDGGAVIVAAAPADEPFNLHEIELDELDPAQTSADTCDRRRHLA